MTASTERKVVDLEAVRADGWFEQLCQVIGRRFVAFSFITGVRISSVAYDPQNPHGSLVDFSVSEGGETQQLPLSELRERLGAALLAGDELEDDLNEDPTQEDIRRYIGRRYLLLAPLFGLGLEAIELSSPGEPMLRLRLGGSTEAISLQGLRDVIHNAIRSEVARSRPSQAFSIDFKKVPIAEAANARAEYDETISLLGSWPGPLSMFLRTPQGQALGPAERSKLVRALSVLGEAYLRKRQHEWAEDVLRLGIQFGQELAASAPLFALLGHARVDGARYGEAIGLLRRALALGGDKRSCLPALARCFIERGRFVAAMACLDEAVEAGADPESLTVLRTRVDQALGPEAKHLASLLSGAESV